MAREVFSTRLNEYERQALLIAAETWKEHADSPSELLRAIVNDWRRGKEDGSGSKSSAIRSIKTDTQEIIRILHNEDPISILQSIAAARVAGCDEIAMYDEEGVLKDD